MTSDAGWVFVCPPVKRGRYASRTEPVAPAPNTVHEWHEAALVDLRDLHNNARDGLHLASMAGAWAALVDGFGGLAVHGDQLCLDPQLPDGMTRLAFRVHWRGMRLRVEVTGEQVRLEVHDHDTGRGVDVVVGDERLHVSAEEPVVRPWFRREPLLPRPGQPVGRAPDPRA